MSRMYTFQYDFFPDFKKANSNEYYDTVLSSFLASLSRNGQIIDQNWNIVEIGEVLRFYCISLQEDSLDTKYYNTWCKKTFTNLVEKSIRPPESIFIGKTAGLSDCCTCESPSFYVLFTNFRAEFPPVTCGDCNLPVPLYRLPYLEGEEEYSSFREWENSYQACDNLFIGSSVGERFGYRQISKIDSSLSKEGLRICREMALKTETPFYYFLHNYYSRPKGSCPLCGGSWKLDEVIHGLYSYKCDNCFLLADKP